jgi:hypothetical protein
VGATASDTRRKIAACCKNLEPGRSETRRRQRATRTRPSPPAALGRDPRLYQIAILSCLLIYGVGWLHFDVSVGRIGLTLATCLASQFLCTRLWALPRFDPRSPLISGLSLCLLLRTGQLAVATASVTVVSKFLLRVDGRHLFNPTNLGLVVMMLVTG